MRFQIYWPIKNCISNEGFETKSFQRKELFIDRSNSALFKGIVPATIAEAYRKEVIKTFFMKLTGF
jgi:hypothetical protein